MKKLDDRSVQLVPVSLEILHGDVAQMRNLDHIERLYNTLSTVLAYERYIP